VADGKNSKDTEDQTGGPDEKATENTTGNTTQVSPDDARPTDTQPTDADSDDITVQREPGSDSDPVDRTTEAEALSGDPAVMTGTTGETATAPASQEPPAEPWMEVDAATSEGMANPPETEVDPRPEPETTAAPVTPEPVSDPAPGPTPAPQVIKETTVERRGGFLSMLLGGVAAAVIGYGYAQYQSNSWPFGTGTEDPFRSQTAASLEQQSQQLDELSSRLGNTETVVGAFDVSDLTEAVAQLGSSVTDLQGQIGDVSDQIGRLEVRVVELEKRPMEAALSPEAVAAYEREMDALRSDIESQRNEIQNFAAEAVAAEQNSDAQMQIAAARAALAGLTVALESGSAFEEQVATLGTTGSVTVPPALASVAADGVATQAELVDAYPDAARAALAAARSEAAPEQGANHVLNFFRDQVGARSVTPREGDDADAVLSRAESALKSGDVAATLAEVTTLSEAAQTAMADWITMAETRVAAQDAAATLAQELNQE